jgi:hypothetical protein
MKLKYNKLIQSYIESVNQLLQGTQIDCIMMLLPKLENYMIPGMTCLFGQEAGLKSETELEKSDPSLDIANMSNFLDELDSSLSTPDFVELVNRIDKGSVSHQALQQ